MGRRRGTKLLLDKLFPQRRDVEQTEKVASALLQGSHHHSHKHLYLKGVHNGRYYRIKLNDPMARSSKHPMPRLPGDGEVPHAFKKIARRTTGKSKPKEKAKDAAPTEQGLRLPGFLKGGGDFSYEEAIAYSKAWWKENWSTVVLNFGSVCTLVGFTRSDVLELRCLSVTGSTANVVYHFTQQPFRPLPVGWSALFALVNSFKIREIVLERHSNVHMTPKQEEIFIQYFMPHGITPRQFQILQESAKEVVIPVGEAIIKQGEVCNHVSLIVSGSTRASISGRRLTAASAIAPKTITEEKAGGNSGAWVGEMNFLEYYHSKVGSKSKKRASPCPAEKEKNTGTKDTKSVQAGDDEKTSADAVAKTAEEKSQPKRNQKSSDKNSQNAAQNETSASPRKRSKPTTSEHHPSPVNRYTIVAADECVIWEWSFDQVEKMMNRSTDFRGSLTRAMTAAIVAKVVNFTISKTSALPTWSTWLDDWRHNAGASVNIKTDDEEIEVEEAEEAEHVPEYNGLDEHGGI